MGVMDVLSLDIGHGPQTHHEPSVDAVVEDTVAVLVEVPVALLHLSERKHCSMDSTGPTNHHPHPHHQPEPPVDVVVEPNLVEDAVAVLVEVLALALLAFVHVWENYCSMGPGSDSTDHHMNLT